MQDLIDRILSFWRVKKSRISSTRPRPQVDANVTPEKATPKNSNEEFDSTLFQVLIGTTTILHVSVVLYGASPNDLIGVDLAAISPEPVALALVLIAHDCDNYRGLCCGLSWARAYPRMPCACTNAASANVAGWSCTSGTPSVCTALPFNTQFYHIHCTVRCGDVNTTQTESTQTLHELPGHVPR